MSPATARAGSLAAITARLSYTREQAGELSAAQGEKSPRDLRALLRHFHDDLLATLTPGLAPLRAEGVLVNYATSWQLGEFVAHAPADRLEEAMSRLTTLPELKDISRGAPLHGRGKRRK